MRRPSALSSVALGLFAAHALALNLCPVGWFGDDLAYIRFAAQNRGASIAQVLRYQDRSLERYRPLTKLLVLQVYRAAELDPALLRLATTVSLGLTILLVLALGRSLGIDGSASRLATILFLLHQLPISALYRNARMEQHFTLFGLAAVYALDRGLRGTARARAASLAIVPVLLGAALLWSEAALCFSLVVTVWSILRGRRNARTVMAVAAGAGLVVSAYLVWYRSVGAPLQGVDRYSLGIGRNVLANVAVAVAGWTSPVSSVAVVDWSRDPPRHAAGLLLAAASSLLVLGYFYGGWRAARSAATGQERAALACLASAGCCLLPVVLLHHVSEFYIYPSLLFACLAAGVLACEREKARARSLSFGGAVAAIVLLLAAAGHVQAAVQKVTLFHRNGERFERLVHELETKARAREQGVVRLVNEVPEIRPISQFVLPLRLVYLTGPQHGYEVEWHPSTELDRRPQGAWIVRENGSIVAVNARTPS